MRIDPVSRIACIGEVMIELAVEDGGKARLNVAGDTYNTAVYMKRLLAGRDVGVSYVTALGRDDLSGRILAHMADEGLSGDLVERRESLVPGLYAISTDSAGERSFTYWRDQSAARTLFQEPCTVRIGDLAGFDLVFLSGITVAVLARDVCRELLDFLASFRKKGGLVAFDSNFRPQLWPSPGQARKTIEAFWRCCDIALPSLDDEHQLFGAEAIEETCRRFAGYGVPFGAIKREAEGPVAIDGTKPKGDFTPVRDVLDTTAAGDSFNAGFLASMAIGRTQHEAAALGHAVASEVIQAKGAIVDLPGSILRSAKPA